MPFNSASPAAEAPRGDAGTACQGQSAKAASSSDFDGNTLQSLYLFGQGVV